MKNTIISSVITVFLISAGFVASAENPPGKLVLKLDDCVKIALQKNPQVRAAMEGIVAARESVGQARSPYYPELKAVAGYSRWQSRAFLPEGLLPPTAPKVIGPVDDFKAQGVARWLLFDGGERGARLDMTKSNAEAAGENLNLTKQDIVLRVHEAFFRLSSSLELKSVADRNLARAEQHLKLANDRKAAGAAPESDILRARVSAAEAKLDLVRTKNLVRINMGILNTVMGTPVEFEIIPLAEPDSGSGTEEMKISSLLTKAIMCRPEIRAAKNRTQAARSSLTMAQSEYGPKVRAEGAYGLRDDSEDLEEEEYAAGISVELSLFSGLSTRHKIAEKKAELAKAEAEAEATAQAVQQEVWIAKSRLQEAREMIQTADARVKDASESSRMAEQRYKVGGCTITDLMDVQTAMAKAEADKVEAEWNLQIAKATLNRTIGTLGLPDKE